VFFCQLRDRHERSKRFGGYTYGLQVVSTVHGYELLILMLRAFLRHISELKSEMVVDLLDKKKHLLEELMKFRTFACFPTYLAS
jgi:hypothetical protein